MMGQQPDSTGAAIPAESTHAARLQDAINSMNGINRHLEDLKDMIGLSVNPTSGQDKEPQATLVTVLNAAPQALQVIEQEAHQNIEELMQALRGA